MKYIFFSYQQKVRFCMKFLSGQKQFPSKAEMRKDTESEMNDRWLRGFSKRQAHLMGSTQVSIQINFKKYIIRNYFFF